MRVTRIFSFILMGIALLCSSCETDEPKNSSSSSSSTTNKQTISKPSFDKFLTTSDKASFSIRVRFKAGGDKEQNLSATVHWKVLPF